MAIDTEVKRGSVLNFNRGILLPIVSGSIDQGDQQTFLMLYSGILADEAILVVVPSVTCDVTATTTITLDVTIEQTKTLNVTMNNFNC